MKNEFCCHKKRTTSFGQLVSCFDFNFMPVESLSGN